jgi:hypothetical protein
MKNLTSILMMIALILFSCERTDFGDTNTDKFAASEGNVDALLRGAIVSYFTLSAGYIVTPTLYAQYQSETQYTDEQRYSEAPGFWNRYYNSLINLKEVASTTDDIRGDVSNLKATAELMSVLIWKRTTDSYGDIPYSEALQGNAIPNPAYSTQESIYWDLIARAKSARDMFSESAFILDSNTDMIYDGDINAWRKFANSLIMGLSLQLTNRYPSPSGDAANAFIEALNNAYGSIESISDEAIFYYDLEGNVVNPFSSLRPADYTLSKEFTDALQGETGAESLNRTSNTNWDNRVNIMSSNPPKDGNPYGYATYEEYGEAIMAKDLVAPDRETVIFSLAYSLLNRAEAAAIGWTGEDESMLLTEGIIASYIYWEVSNAVDYAAERVADAEITSFEQVIGEEKWVALFPDGFAAWAEQRRTGFPDLLAAPEPLNNGTLATRFVYPNEENTINPTNWENAVKTLNPPTDNNSSKMWWDN